MKETTNLTLLIYEYTLGRINLDRVKNPFLKLIPLFLMVPFIVATVTVALLIEEPIKCIFCLIFTKNTSSEVWAYYKKCWSSLRGGMHYDNQM